eukprot:Filipodium_phascolosomae@DN2428_c0_g1_i1.p1
MVSIDLAICLVVPKSLRYTSPDEVTSTFAALISRWMKFALCRAPKANSSSLTMWAAMHSGKGQLASCSLYFHFLRQQTNTSRLPPSAKSITKAIASSVVGVNLTTQHSWWTGIHLAAQRVICLVTDTSARTSTEDEAKCLSGTYLIATALLSLCRRARTTKPKAPDLIRNL